MSFQGFLKADTEVKVVIGPVVSISDGITPVTTLALATADEAEILKHNAAAVTDISGGTMAAIASADGYYNLTMTTGYTDTEGMLVVLINDDSLCLPVKAHFMVVNANVYDSMYAAAATDYLQVDAVQISSDATAANNAELAFDGTGFGFTNCTMPTVTTLTGHTPQTGDSYARIGAPAGASVSADILAIDNFVDDLESRLTATRAGYLDNLNGHVAQSGDNFARIGAPVGASISADIAAVDSDTGTILSRVPAEVAQKQHFVNGTGNITPPVNIGIWDALGDGSKSISGLNDLAQNDILNDATPFAGGNVDAAISSRSDFNEAVDQVIVGTNNDKTDYRLSSTGVDDILDEVVEGTTTLRELLRGVASLFMSKSSGGGTATLVFRDYGDTKDRFTFTVDVSGNRTNVVRDLS